MICTINDERGRRRIDPAEYLASIAARAEQWDRDNPTWMPAPQLRRNCALVAIRKCDATIERYRDIHHAAAELHTCIGNIKVAVNKPHRAAVSRTWRTADVHARMESAGLIVQMKRIGEIGTSISGMNLHSGQDTRMKLRGASFVPEDDYFPRVYHVTGR